jgi:glutamate/tyrosine decarboxylase-like PLP-dependent enzyme
MDPLLTDTAERTSRYLEDLRRRRVGPSPDAVSRLKEFGGPLPAEGMDPSQVLEMLDRVGSPATVGSAGGRYFGFVIGSVLPAALAADWLASAWNQNTAMRVMSPAATELERVSLEWIRDLLGLPSGSRGALVTGDTVANLTCLAAARRAVLQRAGWDLGRRGLVGAPRIRVVVGEEVHVSVLKALAILGFGSDEVARVPVDDQGRMIAAGLPELSGPTIVCAQVGNVNSGASDPVGAICLALQGSGAWVHVDGAFGLWARASAHLRDRYRGVELADSWATDGHKWLNVPYDSGMAFVRDPAAMRAALASPAAAYLPSGGEGEPMEFVPEMSRRARGVACWAALRSLGTDGVAALVDRACGFATTFAEGLRAAGFAVLNDVVLNQVLVSFGDDTETRRVVAALQEVGRCWVGPTVWHGRTAMRISVSSWATTPADVESTLAAIRRVARSG